MAQNLDNQELVRLNQAINNDPYNSDLYHQRGQVFYTLKDYPSALADFKRALELDPDNNDYQTWQEKTQAAISTESPSSRFSDILRRRTEQPQNESSRFGNLRSRFKDSPVSPRRSLSDVPEELKQLNAAIQGNPDDDDSYYKRGIYYFQKGRYTNAVDDFNRAIVRLALAFEPSNGDYFRWLGKGQLHAGNFQASISALTRALEIDGDSGETYYWRGRGAYSLKDYDAALNDFNTSIGVDRRYQDAYLWRGLLYQTLKDYDASVADASTAMDLGMDSDDVYFVRGLSLYLAGNNEMALYDFDRAIEIKPSALLHDLRGRSYFALQNYPDAEADFKTAIKMDSKGAGAYYWLGNLYRVEEKFDDALLNLNKAIRLQPELNYHFEVRGLTFFSMGDYQRAIQDFLRVIQHNPRAVNYRFLGNCYYFTGDLDHAMKYLNKAIEVDPEDHIAFQMRGLTYYRRADFESALEDLTQAIDLQPENDIYYYWRGAVALAIDDYDAAAVDFQTAERLKYDDSINVALSSLWRGVISKLRDDEQSAYRLWERGLSAIQNAKSDEKGIFRTEAVLQLVLGHVEAARECYEKGLQEERQFHKQLPAKMYLAELVRLMPERSDIWEMRQWFDEQLR